MIFNLLHNKLKETKNKTIAVAVAEDIEVLTSLCKIRDMNIANATLVGNKNLIETIAKNNSISLNDFTIIDEADNEKATKIAVELVHNQKANVLMKGIVDTKTFLKAILNKEYGLRTDKLLSHIVVIETEKINRPLLITDVAFNTYPTLQDKVDMINNAVILANTLGIEMPKVAPICAVETVNPKMQCTIEAQELTTMNQNKIIKNCIIDGPLSLDLALDPESAIHKKATSRAIVGDADILLMPDIQAGNILYKWLTHFTNNDCGCVLMGTSSPVVLTSRSDNANTKINSIILALSLANN